MKIEELYKLYKQHFLVDTDTRNIRKNSIFFALKGENFNGNTFAKKALVDGAKYSVVDEKKYATNSNIILVDNVLQTLQNLSNYHRKQLNIPIIGLTGSNGKTTTKELINIVLSKKYKTVATLGNLNNHIGVPLTLLSMNLDTEIGIVEMGANHQKEIDFLSNLCEPNFGYITNFGKAHLEGFGGIEGVIKGKSELYTFLAKNNKIAFVNPNDEIQLNGTNKIERILFEEGLILQNVNPFITFNYKNSIIKSNLIGAYNFTNICAAVTVGNYFNVDFSDIKNAIESYFPDNNRSQIIEKKSNRIILDAYNANPTSMKAAIESFQTMEAKNKIVILGDMFELGDAKTKEHQRIADLVLKIGFKTVLFTGNLFNQVNTNFIKFKEYEDLEVYLKAEAPTNSTLLIKGSRGMKLERILNIFN
jgi:UDP-N-acetylmuramoyl-tripeptide--D-alanyl-D-alanine ligase